MKSRPIHTTPLGQSVRLMKDHKKKRVLLVGGGAREHAIGMALCHTSRVELYVFAHNVNPGLSALAIDYKVGPETDVGAIVSWARSKEIEFTVIGLEDPLAFGLPDSLQEAGIPTVGPVRSAARLETSKLFLRDLMKKHRIPGNVEYRYVTDANELESFLTTAHRDFALKPIGLTAGKGVQVMGVQLKSLDDAIDYGKRVIQTRLGGDAGLLLEERLEGPEFTLQAFVDARTVRPMPLVKDYKLAWEGDTGPNTGSMGSYSGPDGTLAFLSEREHQEAIHILNAVVRAVRAEGAVYRGILYGQFMKTRDGIKLIEINARFGDPEAINVLALLRTDFVDVCEAIIGDTLSSLQLRFASEATVCKYVTPYNYPLAPELGQPIVLDLPEILQLGVRVLFAKVEKDSSGRYLTTSSRSIALLGMASTVEEAHLRVQKALTFVSGRYHVRNDIGTRALTELAVAEWTPQSRAPQTAMR